MNIFVTDISPTISAQNLDDKRVKHMIKECVEILAAAYHSTTDIWVIPFPLWNIEERDKEKLYNHPVVKWVRRDRKNMTWLYYHLIAMIEENVTRFGPLGAFGTISLNGATHKVLEVIYPLINSSQPNNFRNSSLFKDEKNVIEAYRKTMIHKWSVTDKVKPPLWTGRGAPHWYLEAEQLKLDVFLSNFRL